MLQDFVFWLIKFLAIKYYSVSENDPLSKSNSLCIVAPVGCLEYHIGQILVEVKFFVIILSLFHDFIISLHRPHIFLWMCDSTSEFVLDYLTNSTPIFRILCKARIPGDFIEAKE